MARPRVVSDEQRAEILQVALTRRSLPSDKELARRFGMSVFTVKWLIREVRSSERLQLKPISSG